MSRSSTPCATCGHPGLALRHLVHEGLLDRAGESGPQSVTGEIEAVLAGAVAAGATAVLCTCSTIGGVAESLGPALGVPVLRVDRPMAAVAARAERVTVIVAVASTVAPTLALIAEEADAAGRLSGGGARRAGRGRLGALRGGRA